jgi:RimJ/RimL family protein N-acetyltransferase
MTLGLELLSQKHLPALEAELLTDEGVLRFTRVPEPVPPGFAQAWFESYEAGRRDGTREAFAIVDGAGEFLGLALAVRISREDQTAELGYVVAPSARGRGVATEGLRLLTEWSFAELGARRVELWIDVENEPSKRVAERCGYVKEGVLRSIHFKQGQRHDFEIWSRLPTDL